MGVKIKAACDSKCNDSPAATWKNWFIVFFLSSLLGKKCQTTPKTTATINTDINNTPYGWYV